MVGSCSTGQQTNRRDNVRNNTGLAKVSHVDTILSQRAQPVCPVTRCRAKRKHTTPTLEELDFDFQHFKGLNSSKSQSFYIRENIKLSLAQFETNSPCFHPSIVYKET